MSATTSSVLSIEDLVSERVRRESEFSRAMCRDVGQIGTTAGQRDETTTFFSAKKWHRGLVHARGSAFFPIHFSFFLRGLGHQTGDNLTSPADRNFLSGDDPFQNLVSLVAELTRGGGFHGAAVVSLAVFAVNATESCLAKESKVAMEIKTSRLSFPSRENFCGCFACHRYLRREEFPSRMTRRRPSRILQKGSPLRRDDFRQRVLERLR